jgi:Mn2+/Fe2+ NRAMP family transporter
MGPGLVAGAANVDPTTVATMSVIGATTLYDLSWLTILMVPVLVIIQIISSHVGVQGRSDLQHFVRRAYGRPSQFLLLGLVLVVTIITIAADLEAGAAAVGLLLHAPWRWFVVPLGLLTLALLVFGTYDEVEKVLKYVLLVLLTYVVAAVLANAEWGQVLHHSIMPTIGMDKHHLDGSLALLGTTLTSYVYIWQTIEMGEEGPSRARLWLKKIDAAFGMFFGVAIFWFILVATGATLGVHHEHVETAQDAARALRPVAGRFASYLFGIGLLGSSLLALPVLVGTAAYVVGAQFDWERGLSHRLHEASKFYAVIAASIILSVVVSLVGVQPITLLFMASIAAGIATPVSLAYLVIVASNKQLMKGHPIGPWLRWTGALIAAAVGLVGLIYLASQFFG